uniref:Uncharacterized protein n=1 Tax=Glossina brevipalpis TaxID=37001 RepID=A0A1A9W3C5_9MUSC
MLIAKLYQVLLWLAIAAICLLDVTDAEPGYYIPANNTGPSYQSPIVRPNMFGYYYNHSRWNSTGYKPVSFIRWP